MSANSIAPSGKAVDIYFDDPNWKVALYASDRTTPIASTTIGGVTVGADSIVAIPLDLRAMGGDAAHELRIFGAGVIKVRHVEALNADFPVAALTVVEAEVPGQQFNTIEAIGSGITRVRIAWGAKS